MRARPDLLRTLGLPSDADETAVKSAFRRLAKELQALLDQKTPRYRGVGVSVQPTAAPSSSSAVQPAASPSSAKESH